MIYLRRSANGSSDTTVVFLIVPFELDTELDNDFAGIDVLAFELCPTKKEFLRIEFNKGIFWLCIIKSHRTHRKKLRFNFF